MELHDLFSAALKDLPEMPDQIPAAARIARRRRTAVRTGVVVAGASAAIAVGALAVTTPWAHSEASAAPAPATASTSTAPSSPPGPPTSTPSSPPSSISVPVPTATGPVSLADYPAHVVSVLGGLLPAGYHVSWTGGHDHDLSRYEPYQVTVDSRSYPVSLDPMSFSSSMVNSGHMKECRPTRYKGATCAATTLPDGTVDMVIREPEGVGASADTLASVYLWRGDHALVLNLSGGLGDDLTNAQLFTLAKAPAFQQLYTEALDDGLFS